MNDEGHDQDRCCPECGVPADRHPDVAPLAATCPQCGTVTPVESEDDRVAALLQRVRADDAATLDRMREAVGTRT